jgi:hypothetical protein
MQAQRPELVARQIPNAHRAVVPGRGDEIAERRKGDLGNGPGVALERRGRAAIQIDDARLAGRARDHHPPLIGRDIRLGGLDIKLGRDLAHARIDRE